MIINNINKTITPINIYNQYSFKILSSKDGSSILIVKVEVYSLLLSLIYLAVIIYSPGSLNFNSLNVEVMVEIDLKLKPLSIL